MEKKESNTADREIKISRLFNAPVDLVWEVWTDPDHIKNWWGPNGFSNTISKMDIRPEGEWILVMHGPDGTDYKNKSIFKEVITNKKLVYEHVTGPKFLATIFFESRGEQTFLEWHMLFETKEEFINTVETFKADEGLKQNIEKLNRYLDDQLHLSETKPDMKDSNGIHLEKVLHAPVSLVWEAISDKEMLRQWYFDFSEDYKLETGHVFEWHAGPPGGKQWLHRAKMLEVVKEKKLSHSWEYPGYTGSSIVTWELSPIDANTTRLNFSHVFTIPFDAKEEALRRENFVQGWNHIINTSLPEFIEKVK